MSDACSGRESDPSAASGKEVLATALGRAGNSETALDRLQRLLHRQLELVHRGSLSGMVELCDQTDRCVQQLVRDGRTGTQERPGPGATGQWTRVQQLYQELYLAVATQRQETLLALRAIHRGKRILRTYGSHLSST
jgi:hypothetical protein